MIRKINVHHPETAFGRMAHGVLPQYLPRLPGSLRSPEGRIQCMSAEWESVRGILRKGYGVASGPSQDYPYGALERQVPIFQARGLDLSTLFHGTLNIDIRPFTFRIVMPEFTFRDVFWTDLHPPEHFSFSQCSVLFGGTLHAGWVYYPHPETKRRHFQDPSLLEVIAEWIPDIKPGDELQVFVKRERILLRRLSQGQ